MPATANSHSLRFVPATASSKSGSASKNSTRGAASPARPAPVAHSSSHYHQSQGTSTPASTGRAGGSNIACSTHLDVTLGARSPNSAPNTNEKQPRSLASEISTNSAKPATGKKLFDFKYKNVYTTPPARSGGRTTRGRSTIGSGSGAGSGMGSCSIM